MDRRGEETEGWRVNLLRRTRASFATSTGTLDREDMSELSDISTEIVATRRSPTDSTMMAGVKEKQATSSSFSERVKKTFGNIFPFNMGVGR